MNKSKSSKYYNKKFHEIPVELFPKIKEILDKEFAIEGFRDLCMKMIRENGLNNWFVGNHFTTGMKIRNVLRENGILDNMFPDENLDDYYVCMIEWWLDCRRINGNPT